MVLPQKKEIVVLDLPWPITCADAVQTVVCSYSRVDLAV